MLVVLNVVIDMHAGLFDIRILIRLGRQGPQGRFVQLLELAEPRAGQLLEGALIEIIQQHADGLIECGQGEEALMAQAGHDPALDDLYRHLGLGFIPGFIRTRRHDDTLVMGSQLLITGVDVRLIAMSFTHRTFQVVRHHQELYTESGV